ncbi:MAG: ATP-binding cassette domain-containing protein [Acidiphilium sp.]|nr:ATP-binding cassette domain-containing protein [Acidiphilium sp.]MDD4936313.1 ATP-binding cassette domain-containing protein [Acidiphilium sp.]
MAAATILIDRIGFAYTARSPRVLDDVSLTIAPGAITALVGRSGSGKSSLLHIIAGLAKPSAGQIVIDGVAVDGPTPRAVMMFQSPSLYPWLTVAENVAIGLRFAGLKHPDIARRVADTLALVGLEGAARSRATSISGGQAQRAALARALVMQPDVLLLDEPFAALDLFTRLDLQRDIRAIAKRFNITVVLVSHDIPEIARMADRAAFLAGSPARIVTETAISEAARCDDDEASRAEIARLTALYEQVSGAATPQRAPIVHTAAATPAFAQ